jgi:hypothetical protein
MIWLTWRQFRIQAITGGVILAAAAVVLIANSRLIASAWADSGAASCPATGECPALDSFDKLTSNGATVTLFILATALLYLVPPMVGLFWGAPLVAREIETGTHRLVWNQSVTRSRWLAVKLAVLCSASMLFAGVLSLGVWWSSYRLDEHVLSRVGPLLFGARGIVPVGYAAFAFVLGVTAGIMIRRTVPAMAATLGVYVAAIGAMTLWGRAHLLPATTVLKPLPAMGQDTIEDFGWNQDGVMHIVARANLDGAWVLRNDTVTSTGALFKGPADPVLCGRGAPPQSCEKWVNGLGLRQDLVYQPASHFWGLQWAEAGVFLALAAVLTAWGFWWLRRRVA